MAYKINNGNIVSKDTSGNNRSFIKVNVDNVISECKKQGITNKYLIAGILATISKESGFVPQNENLNYSSQGLVKTFPSKFGVGKENASEYEKKPEKIANFVYGGKYGNSNPGDGYKYRGRGFNQITFKDIYVKYGNTIPNILENPDKLNEVSNASKSAVYFYVDGFKSKKIKEKFNKSAYDVSDWNEALLIVINVTAGIGNSKNSEVVRYNYDKAKKCHGFLIEYIEGIPEEKESNLENNNLENTEVPEEEQNSGSDNKDSNQNNNTGLPVKNLTQFFVPSIAPTAINFNADLSSNDQNKIAKQLGYMPFIWYNGIQISYQDISSFTLFHKGILPAVEITFVDSWGILREDGFPQDDTIVTIYLNSKSMSLRSIHMDFKILNFKDCGNNTYNLSGICNIPQIFISKFLSYSSKTSHETIQEVAKECQLGFCSNVNNSDDKMTWINPGFKRLDFIEDTMNNSYISETSFQYCYVDFYYNICYVDINKELERDVSNDKMIVGFGYKFLTGDEENELDEKTTNLFLSNDRGVKESIGFFNKFDITNRSTKISLEKSYRTRTKYYDSTKKELLIFDVESQTSDGSKSIILKGSANDEKFFKENTTNIYVGKMDFFDNGEGNVHKNYNYSIPQNRQNLDDITKISCILTLPSNNFNLYVYQKLPIYFSPQIQTPTIQNDFYKRISGDWFITGIEFRYDSGQSYQIVKAIKRELTLLKEEIGGSSPKKTGNNSENNVNELSPND